MKRAILILTTLKLLLSCNSADPGKTYVDTETPNGATLNKRLQTFQIRMLYTVGDMESVDKNTYEELYSETLNPKKDTVRFLKDKIYISCVKPASGCAEYKGDITFKNDTITLQLKKTSEISCTEMIAWRVIYEIENKENKKYVIRKF